MHKITKPIIYFSLAITGILILVFANLILNRTDNSDDTFEIIDVVEDPFAKFTEGRKHFNMKCAMCHRLNAKSTPDLLSDLEIKMNPDYFHLYITRQDSLINVKDNFAMKRFAEIEANNWAVNHNFKFTTNENLEIYKYIVAKYAKQ